MVSLAFEQVWLGTVWKSFGALEEAERCHVASTDNMELVEEAATLSTVRYVPLRTSEDGTEDGVSPESTTNELELGNRTSAAWSALRDVWRDLDEFAKLPVFLGT